MGCASDRKSLVELARRQKFREPFEHSRETSSRLAASATCGDTSDRSSLRPLESLNSLPTADFHFGAGTPRKCLSWRSSVNPREPNAYRTSRRTGQQGPASLACHAIGIPTLHPSAWSAPRPRSGRQLTCPNPNHAERGTAAASRELSYVTTANLRFETFEICRSPVNTRCQRPAAGRGPHRDRDYQSGGFGV